MSNLNFFIDSLVSWTMLKIKLKILDKNLFYTFMPIYSIEHNWFSLFIHNVFLWKASFLYKYMKMIYYETSYYVKISILLPV